MMSKTGRRQILDSRLRWDDNLHIRSRETYELDAPPAPKPLTPNSAQPELSARSDRVPKKWRSPISKSHGFLMPVRSQ